ncbi:MAG TPA: NUDIX domain-containing protein [Candidatus Nanoarchaeia archaeon]|nr:NUDIX domain-containing protein [Candidatus Nanoarchaeia archaeon]
MKHHMVEGWLYRKVNNEILYLLLKRSSDKGGFWQPVAGRVETSDADTKEAALREILEETGISKDKLGKFHDRIHEFTINKHYLTQQPIPPIHEVAHAFECFTFKCNMDMNNDQEHETYGWFSYEQALKLLKWNDNKDAMIKLNRQINEEKI